MAPQTAPGSHGTFKGEKPSPRCGWLDICQKRKMKANCLDGKSQETATRRCQGRRYSELHKVTKPLIFPGPQCREPTGTTMRDPSPRTWEEGCPQRDKPGLDLPCGYSKRPLKCVQKNSKCQSGGPRIPTARPAWSVTVIGKAGTGPSALNPVGREPEHQAAVLLHTDAVLEGPEGGHAHTSSDDGVGGSAHRPQQHNRETGT